MFKALKGLPPALLVALLALPASAQEKGRVLAECGTVPSGFPYVVGQLGAVTVNEDGEFCVAGVLGGGGGGSGDASEAEQETQTAILTTIDADTGAVALSVDTVEAVLGAIDTDTGGMALSLDDIEAAAENTDPVIVTFEPTGRSATAVFTPAAASHVANDVNGGAQAFNSIGTPSEEAQIVSATLMISGATAEATAWKVCLYNVTPPSAIADDGAWDIASGDRASFLGCVALGTAVDLVSTQWVETHSIDQQVAIPASGNLFGYLVNDTTLTPAAAAHTVTLHTVVP